MTRDAKDTTAADAGLAAYFTNDHRHCDAGWAEVEGAAESGQETAVVECWQRFDRNLRRHLAMEEELLFPAFEAATGMHNAGPSHVMRMEHEQMRGVLDQMAAAIDRGDRDELLDQGETLHILIQQHNMKEEGMLYPMAEQVLAAEWPGLREKLEGFDRP
jgi:hemerythrin-like domain-containing protein